MNSKRYNHSQIEKKWQKIWSDKQLFVAEKSATKPKYYVLDMFPYPSGSGLHVGHVTGYTGTDIIARFKRQQGLNVLHPMGWDSFGLPAEQFAMRTGTHPRLTTEKNIDTYRKQLTSLGLSYDWSREFATSDPSYYKWTQWLFTKLYDKGLAYEAELNVNYCPTLKTVLANEEVENGRSKEGGYPVIRRPIRQWILKITAYADRLLQDLNTLDWPDNLKRLQSNWIGRSEGAEITFYEEGSNNPITVFTTRPDTLFGVSYLVLAPEHPLVKEITKKDQLSDVEAYIEQTALKSDLERTELEKEKSGVWTGAYAQHPITKEKLPIWISDYVLLQYAHGAVMAVPAHDERDFAFAKKFHLPIHVICLPENESPKVQQQIMQHQLCWPKEGKIINSDFLNHLSIPEAKAKMIAYIEKEGFGKKAISYKLRDWLFSRQRYWGEPIPILHFEDGTKRALELDELPLTPPEIEDYHPAEGGESPLAKEKQWVEFIDPKTGKKAIRETNTMPQWAGSCWYYLRFCDPHNENSPWSTESEKYWMNVDLYVGGAEHAVLHLLYARFWHKVFYDLNLVSHLEPFQKYRYQGIVTAPAYKKKEGGYVHPDDVEKVGNAYISKLTNEEVECQIEKMSKSKLNGVSPTEIIDEYGADALRLYAMFMGPFDKEKIWNSDAIAGCKRFLNRFFDLAYSENMQEDDVLEAVKLSHRLANQVFSDIEDMQFNTAIARMMEFVNAIVKLPTYCKTSMKIATQALYPFAPHLAEEIWQHLGQTESLTFAPLPKINQKYLIDDVITYVIQVNGKVRARVELGANSSKEELLDYAHKNENVAKFIKNGIIKTIFVPGKLLNLVVKGN